MITVYESAAAAGHTPTCATSQHMSMTSVCICGRDLTLAPPSPIMRALDVATRLIAQAQAQGIDVNSVTAGRVGGIQLYAEDPALTAALAVALGLTERSVYTLDDRELEFFRGTVEGVRVQTHGPIPEPARIAEWSCPCGVSGYLLEGATDEDRADYDESAALHFDLCEVES